MNTGSLTMGNFNKLRCFVVIVFFFQSFLSLGQQFSDKCELDGRLFYNYCTKYIGQCLDNKANGYGELVLNNNDVLRGVFKDNKLQDNFIEYHYSETGKFIIGPNKGIKLNGTCLLISNNRASLANYENGIYRGNSDYFQIAEPQFDLNAKFCDKDFYDFKNGGLIPNTSRIVYVAQRTGSSKSWISVVDLKSNKIVFNYGDFTHPISVSARKPFFEGFSSDGRYAFYDIRVTEKDSPKYVKCNLLDGTKSITTSLPQEILRKREFNEIVNSYKYKTLENLKGADYANKYIHLNDSSYVKLFHSKEYLENIVKWTIQIGPMESLVKFDRNHNIIKSIDFPNSIIYDFDVDEMNDRIAILYGNNQDSTFLSYYDLTNFEKISDVFRDKIHFFASTDSRDKLLEFSKSGTYLIVHLSDGESSGNLVYLGNKLFCGILGDLYGLNVEENIAITNYFGKIYAFDLEKKRFIWKYEVVDSFWNTNFFSVENKIYLMCSNYSSSDGGNSKTKEEGHRLISVEMPKPLFSVQEFVKIPEEVIVDLSKNELHKDYSSNGDGGDEASNSYTSNELMLIRTLAFLNLMAKKEGTNKFSGKSRSNNSGKSNSSSGNSVHCANCGKSFTCQQGWYRIGSRDVFQYGDSTWDAQRIFRRSIFGSEIEPPKYCCKLCAIN